MGTKFVSKYGNHKLTVKPGIKKLIGDEVIPVPGVHIQFHNNEYIAKTPEEERFIRNHRHFGITIFEDKRAEVEVTPESTAPTIPVEDMNRDQLVQYAEKLDMVVEPDDTNDEIRKAIFEKLNS